MSQLSSAPSSLSSSRSTTVKLHTAHDWGGGLERWLQDYIQADIQADDRSTHWVLRSQVRYDTGCLNHQLTLYSAADWTQPTRQWKLQLPIYGAAIYHAEYQCILREIITVFGIEAVMISSFIGHSLDLLRTGLPTIVVGHDYFPFCPAVVIYCEHKTCQTCHLSELQHCLSENPLNMFFPSLSPMTWMRLRESFNEAMLQPNVALVAPSASVQKNLIQLAPGLKAANWIEISHGISLDPWQTVRQAWMADFDRGETGPLGSLQAARPAVMPNSRGAIAVSRSKLKVLVLGSLNDHKGFSIFEAIAPRLVDDVEFLLMGCGDAMALKVAGWPGVTVVTKTYDREDLPQLLRQASPDLALFLAFWAETFSYTLSEVSLMGIPPVALAVGSFENRIEEGVTGFLVRPKAATLTAMADGFVERLQTLAQTPDKLLQIKFALRERSPRSLAEMVQDYQVVIAQLQQNCQTHAIQPITMQSAANAFPIEAAYQLLFDEVTELQSQVRVLNAKLTRQTLESERYLLMVKQSWIWTALKRVRGLSQKVKYKLQAVKRRLPRV